MAVAHAEAARHGIVAGDLCGDEVRIEHITARHRDSSRRRRVSSGRADHGGDVMTVLRGKPDEVTAAVPRRAKDDERVMWRGADTGARDLKSNALIAVDARDQSNWLLKG